jgi:hypothetical protein
MYTLPPGATLPNFSRKIYGLSLLLVPCIAMLSGCAFYRELSSPWKTYQGIPNTKQIPFDTVIARLKPFEAKHDLKIKMQAPDAIEYEHVIYFSGGDGGTPTTCRLVVYTYNNVLNAFANPCRTYPNSKTGWTDTSRIQNSGDQQAILNAIYYGYIDPTNDSSKIIMDRDNVDDILGDEGKLKLIIASKRFLRQ